MAANSTTPAPTDRASSPAAGVTASTRRRGRIERGVLAQDALLELLERAARLEAELVPQPNRAAPVRIESLGLPPRAVEREHELLEQMLAERMRRDERVELGTSSRSTTEREVGVDPSLERSEPSFLQPGDLRRRPRLEAQI